MEIINNNSKSPQNIKYVSKKIQNIIQQDQPNDTDPDGKIMACVTVTIVNLIMKQTKILSENVIIYNDVIQAKERAIATLLVEQDEDNSYYMRRKESFNAPIITSYDTSVDRLVEIVEAERDKRKTNNITAYKGRTSLSKFLIKKMCQEIKTLPYYAPTTVDNEEENEEINREKMIDIINWAYSFMKESEEDYDLNINAVDNNNNNYDDNDDNNGNGSTGENKGVGNDIHIKVE